MAPQSEVGVIIDTTTYNKKLYDEIEAVLALYRKGSPAPSLYGCYRRAQKVASIVQPLLNLVVGLISMLALSIALWKAPNEIAGHPIHMLEIFVIFFLLCLNVMLTINEGLISSEEVYRRVVRLAERCKKLVDRRVSWTVRNYPQLNAPTSPCINLQWVKRNDRVLNVPWNLLVKGDILLLKPGQEVPATCKDLYSREILTAGSKYLPKIDKPQEGAKPETDPKLRRPYANGQFQLKHSLCHSYLMTVLKMSTCKHSSFIELQWSGFESCMIWTLLGMTVVGSLLFAFTFGQAVINGGYVSLVALNLVSICIPCQVLTFPFIWLHLSTYALTVIKLQVDSQKKNVKNIPSPLPPRRWWQGLVRQRPKPVDEDNIPMTFWRTYMKILNGEHEDMTTRKVNFVNTFATITRLCCVDKKGILSWPNPTAEKIFFLRDRNAYVDSRDLDSVETGQEARSGQKNKDDKCATVAEVLDLTHEQTAAFSVNFDDPTWKDHLAILKPLGLSTLLNTCAAHPTRRYDEFCSYLTCEALASEDLVPVANRRCLCGLALQIGFTHKSVEDYHMENLFPVYRHLGSETVAAQTKLARSMKEMQSNVKVPLPHMLSVVVSDKYNHKHLLTQGTADIVLDSCLDYWNGTDLKPLSLNDRKKIMDFYQRNTLGAYCTAFCYKDGDYRPVTRKVTESLDSYYLELPINTKLLYNAQESAAAFHSADPLLQSEVNREGIRVYNADTLFDLVTNQVFLAMVSMQYQPRNEMVDLIEQLDQCCIRFVHFSPENEMRSKTFCEKMGIEVGWNCHISLKGDDEKDLPHLETEDDTSDFNVDETKKTSPPEQKIPFEDLKRKYSEEDSSLVLASKSTGGGGAGDHFSGTSEYHKLQHAKAVASPPSNSDDPSYLHTASMPCTLPHVEAHRTMSDISDDISLPFDYTNSSEGKPKISDSTTPPDTDEGLQLDELNQSFARAQSVPTHIPLNNVLSVASTSRTDTESERRAYISPEVIIAKQNSPTPSMSTESHNAYVDTSNLIRDILVPKRINLADLAALRAQMTPPPEDQDAELSPSEIQKRQRAELNLQQQVHEKNLKRQLKGENMSKQLQKERQVQQDLAEELRKRDKGDSEQTSKSEEVETVKKKQTTLQQRDRRASQQTGAAANKDRAQSLPRGMRAIRNHVSKVDSVPLEVSLYTDATPQATREMMILMQQAKAELAVIGSVANYRNLPIYNQANLSLLTEPDYPVLCERMDPVIIPEYYDGPIELSNRIAAIAGPMLFPREALSVLYPLLMLARHYTFGQWNCMLFVAYNIITLTFLQYIPCVTLLMAPLTVGQIMWLSCVVVPILGATFMFSPQDPKIENRPSPPYKEEKIAPFVFNAIVVIVCNLAVYLSSMINYCNQIAETDEKLSCRMFMYPSTANRSTLFVNDRPFHGWMDIYYDGYYKAQHLVMISLTMCFLVMSLSYSRRLTYVWKIKFWQNVTWSIAALLIMLVQLLYSTIMLSFENGLCSSDTEPNTPECNVPYEDSWLQFVFMALAPCIVLYTCEQNKHYFIMVNRIRRYELKKSYTERNHVDERLRSMDYNY